MEYTLTIKTNDIKSLGMVISQLDPASEHHIPEVRKMVPEPVIAPPREIMIESGVMRSCQNAECGKRFVPKTVRSHFCSKTCASKVYNARFAEKHSHTALDAKLKKIKQECPAPAPRPNITRDFQGS